MKKIITLLALLTMLFTSVANARKYIELEDNSLILGKWNLYAETAALHKTKKMVQNEWHFSDKGILTSVAFDPRLDGKKSINVTYKVEDGVIKKQAQPGRDKVENCRVVKLEGDDMILHCRFLYYLFRR